MFLLPYKDLPGGCRGLNRTARRVMGEHHSASDCALNWTSYHCPLLCIDHSEMCQREVRLNRDMESVPQCDKDHNSAKQESTQLGWTAWLAQLLLLFWRKTDKDLSAPLWWKENKKPAWPRENPCTRNTLNIDFTGTASMGITVKKCDYSRCSVTEYLSQCIVNQKVY